MRRSSTWMMVCAVSILMGCGGQIDDSQAESPSGQQEEFVSQTLIWTRPDGTLEQSTRYITLAEQRAQFEERKAQQQATLNGQPSQMMGTLIVDCNNPSALWLFDQSNLTGNQLCLYKNPADAYAVQDLGKVWRLGTTTPVRNWIGAPKSLWAGADAGNLATCDLQRMACYSNAPYASFYAGQVLGTINYTPGLPSGPVGPNAVFLEL